MDKEFNELKTKLNAVEIIANRASRKGSIVKETKVAPSIIAFHAHSASGILFRYVFFKGVLVKAIYSMKAAIQKDVNNAVRFHCELANAAGSQSHFINTKKLTAPIELNLPVKQGDVLTISGETSDIIFEDISITLFFITADLTKEGANEIL